ncbi:ribosome biogenesis/translation initiation ATPase RLI [Candidatus Woesearchaeota archaeon]|nr:ribosome biogenesis/translation initiation ATPase RLI [Candidatus Woesearchaeota archaeon]
MARIAVIERAKCINGKGCDLICGAVCPVNRQEKECVSVGDDGKSVIDEKLCIGCGICPKKCPTKCIQIINLPEALSEEPIHRHGVNGFELFSLPTPMFGKVVGIIGQNGIGKSTALKILAGLLKPNLSEIGKEAEYGELIERFKGTEAQGFFEKLKAGEIKISYKPQEVSVIPESFDGKVGDLLKKVDEKGRLDEIVEVLELEKFWDNDIKNISGGELQRVAIAATVLKDANLYMFDEPTSYLDIKQRIKISQFIRSLATEDTAVLVIEHDLIILDYMTDLVNIMYGKGTAYGIVAQPRPTRTAINVYLLGYLKEENIRFRGNEIKFEEKSAAAPTVENILTKWDEFEKKIGNFSLKASFGELYKNEVVGVLGENSIGKTSFVKELSSKDLGGKVSYKPQYLKRKSEPVAMYLKDAAANFKTQLIGPLNIEPLLDKNMDELSGGEHQRVEIVKCLSAEAEIFLLDEPSAYLDVEQRLLVSKIIKDFMFTSEKAALIVDHDLLFIDYLSEKLIVFEGEPAVSGFANKPMSMIEGMNKFLMDLQMTFRRDQDSHRPRANKPGSQKDKEQKRAGKLYYS